MIKPENKAYEEERLKENHSTSACLPSFTHQNRHTARKIPSKTPIAPWPQILQGRK
jgi:hypothetical protein